MKVRDAENQEWTLLEQKDTQTLERHVSPERDYQFDIYVEYNNFSLSEANIETMLTYTPKGEEEVQKHAN